MSLANRTITLTIPNGTALSNSVNLDTVAPDGVQLPLGQRVLVLTLPAAWTAANITVRYSADGTNFNDLYDRFGNEYTITAAASRSIIIPAADFLGLSIIQFRSGTAGTPVNQGAARTLSLGVRVV